MTSLASWIMSPVKSDVRAFLLTAMLLAYRPGSGTWKPCYELPMGDVWMAILALITGEDSFPR